MFSSSEQPQMKVQAPLPGLKHLVLEQMSDEAFWEYARQRAYTLPDVSLRAEYLECKLHDKLCLVALRDLAEVLPPPHRLARLPGMPAWMAGVMAWRGETIAVVNLALYLLPDREGDISWEADGMLLVAGQIGQALGLLVPALGSTSTIEFEQITALTTPTGFKLEDEAEIVGGNYADLTILKIPALLTALVQQIGMAATYHG
jgi:chemotaxis signal transduction protein